MEIGENAYAQLPRDYSADSEDVVKVCIHICTLYIALFAA